MVLVEVVIQQVDAEYPVPLASIRQPFIVAIEPAIEVKPAAAKPRQQRTFIVGILLELVLMLEPMLEPVLELEPMPVVAIASTAAYS